MVGRAALCPPEGPWSSRRSPLAGTGLQACPSPDGLETIDAQSPRQLRQAILAGNVQVEPGGDEGLFAVMSHSRATILTWLLIITELVVAVSLYLRPFWEGSQGALALLGCGFLAFRRYLKSHADGSGCGCTGRAIAQSELAPRILSWAFVVCAVFGVLLSAPKPLGSWIPAATLAFVGFAGALSIFTILARERRTRVYGEVPCEYRPISEREIVGVLSRSSEYAELGISERPQDVFREGCWAFAVFPFAFATEAVFALQLDTNEIRVAVVPAQEEGVAP